MLPVCMSSDKCSNAPRIPRFFSQKKQPRKHFCDRLLLIVPSFNPSAGTLCPSCKLVRAFIFHQCPLIHLCTHTANTQVHKMTDQVKLIHTDTLTCSLTSQLIKCGMNREFIIIVCFQIPAKLFLWKYVFYNGSQASWSPWKGIIHTVSSSIMT